MKTVLSLLFLALAVASAPLRAQTDDSQLRLFASCAGRLSAVMEYQWMFDGVASERTELQRASVLQLVEATMPDGMGREVLHWRLSAKLAQSALLTRATFSDDQSDAAWAAQMADRLTRECTALILS